MSAPWSDPALSARYDAEFRAIVDFARGSRVDTGFGYMGPDGQVDVSRPVELWITCRMTHVFCLAAMQGIEGAAELADHGLAALRGPLHDPVNGGWYSQIGHAADAEGNGIPVPGSIKEAYAHAFVVLASSSAVAAGRPGARDLLDQALDAEERFWWEPEYGRVRESWDLAFTHTEDYRGVNANMHTTECFLSAYDVTEDATWLDRAVGILRFVHDQAATHDWRIPEHFSATWEPLPDYNRDQPAHPFRPFGVTPGHGLEWSRLMLQARAALLVRNETPGEWMLDGARHLFDRAVTDGWDVDGKPGFVYTTDFEGAPMVRERMHWVLCEAIGAAIVQGKALVVEDAAVGSSAHAEDIEALGRDVAVWDDYAWHLLREAPGRWFHELTPENTPGMRTWPGKPDAYHIAQMLLLPRLPATPTFAVAIRNGLLEPLD